MSEISKNINEGNINAGGSVIIGDNNKIQHILGNLEDYKNLEQLLKEDRHLLSLSDGPQARGIISTRINKNEEKRKNIKKAIEQAFDYISKITISTERLDMARVLFLKGDIPRALDILKDDVIHAAYQAILQAKQDEEERHSKKMEDLEQGTKGIAAEWKMKAVLMATQYDDEDWFEKTKDYYMKVLDVSRDVKHIFNYAYFLSKHNQHIDAILLYEEALQIYRSLAQSNSQTFLPDVATTLNNLAVLHSDKNELEKAEEEYVEALGIYSTLPKGNSETFLPDVAMTLNNLANLHCVKNELEKAEEEYAEALGIYSTLPKGNPEAFLPDVAMTLNNLANLHRAKNELEKAEDEYAEALEIRRILANSKPQTFLPDVATTLNNLAVLHWNKNELKKAEEEYTEALEIRRSLALSNPQTFLPDVATTLNNLAVLHSTKNELEKVEGEYEEALGIYRSLAQSNPQTFLPDVAMTLNNLAILHRTKNELKKAEGEYEEALGIYRSLAQSNPQTFMPDVANTSSNMAIFYQYNQPDRELSLELVKEALRAAMPFEGYLKFAQDTIERAKRIIGKWGLDVEAFLNELEAENK